MVRSLSKLGVTSPPQTGPCCQRQPSLCVPTGVLAAGAQLETGKPLLVFHIVLQQVALNKCAKLTYKVKHSKQASIYSFTMCKMRWWTKSSLWKNSCNESGDLDQNMMLRTEIEKLLWKSVELKNTFIKWCTGEETCEWGKKAKATVSLIPWGWVRGVSAVSAASKVLAKGDRGTERSRDISEGLAELLMCGSFWK